MIDTEKRLEVLLDLERARALERELRLDSEAFLSGLNVLSKSENPQEMFSELIKMLREIFKFEDAFILSKSDKNTFEVLASSNNKYNDFQWQASNLFNRVTSGEPIAVFNVSSIPEWNIIPQEITANIKSALHVPLSNGEHTALLVAIHSKPHTFGPRHVKLARRFAPLISQAFANISLKRLIAERDRLFTMSLDMMGIADFDGVFRQLNSAWEKTLKYSISELSEKRLIKFVVPEDRKKILNIFRDLHLGITHEDFELRCLSKDNKIKWLLCSVGFCNIERLCYVVARDITTLKTTQNKLSFEADHDTLTGLSNRKVIIKNIEHSLRKAQKDNRYRFALLFLDLDRFKLINDSLGHIIGDELLVEIASRIVDVTPENSLVSRLGGDEFLVLLKNIKDISVANNVAKNIQHALRHPIKLNGFNIVCTSSIGITSNYLSYQTPTEMLRDADTAMYFAKNNGGASHSVFNAEMHTKAVNHLKLEAELRIAIDNNELEVSYQPIIGLNDHRIEGFEALIRWQKDKDLMLNATEFISIAEESELISLLGHWVINKVCTDISSWQKEIDLADSLFVSINLSAKQLWQKDLLSDVKSILNRHKLPASRIKFEVTESIIMDNTRGAITLLQKIKNYGIGLFIDDFGTGYSSLSYLHKLPFDYLKIDKSFVSRMQCDPSCQDIVKAINLLSKSLHLKVIAEGIETEQQLKLLSEMECDFGQGFLFSEKVDSRNVISLLEDNTCSNTLRNEYISVSAV